MCGSHLGNRISQFLWTQRDGEHHEIESCILRVRASGGDQERELNLHPNLMIVPSRCKHGRLCIVPRNSIDASTTMTIKSFNKATCVTVPDVDFRIYSKRQLPAFLIRESQQLCIMKPQRTTDVPSPPLTTTPSVAPPQVLLITN